MTERIEKIELNGFEKCEQTNLLKLTLDNWIKLVKRYSDFLAEDATYWYNERATLSTFAAAVWQNEKCCAIEEYSNKKIGKDGKEKNGRCDLYFLLNETSYACEAKQAWQKVIPSAIKNLDITEKAVNLASIATNELSKDEADIRLSLTFCVPYFPKEEIQQLLNPEEEITSNIKLFCNALENWIKCKQDLCDGIAYIFPKQSRLLQTDNGIFYPGVVLLIKKIT